MSLRGLATAFVLALLMWALIVLAVLGFTGQIATAHAYEVYERDVNACDHREEDVTKPMLSRLLRVADDYWSARGVATPVGATWCVVPNAIAEPENALGFGELGGPRFWVAEWVMDLLAHAPRASGRGYVCMIVVHERGHNAGLPHDSGDRAMSKVGIPHWWTIPKCRRFAEAPWQTLPRAS